MGESKIEWTEKVWNPVTGCTKVSEGCRNCYAERMAKRLAAMPKTTNKYSGTVSEKGWTSAVQLDHAALDEPLRWKKPSRVFVCSMGDLFHKDVPDEFIKQVFAAMTVSNQHSFMVLTKRPERMKQFISSIPREFDLIADNFAGFVEFLPWLSGRVEIDGGASIIVRHGIWPPSNILFGVSVEDQKTADERIPLLLGTSAAKRFVSYEPALGPVDFPRVDFHCDLCSGTGILARFPKGKCHECDGRGDIPSISTDPKFGSPSTPMRRLDWVIMGGESGPGARPMHPAWARSVRDQCAAAGVVFFMKQMSKKAPIPEDLMIREFPNAV